MKPSQYVYRSLIQLIAMQLSATQHDQRKQQLVSPGLKAASRIFSPSNNGYGTVQHKITYRRYPPHLAQSVRIV